MELLRVLQGKQRPTFKEVWDHLVKARTNDGKATMYPTIGLLIGYLICTDLVYAGVLDPPSLEDMGKGVASIGKGGRAGLKWLGLIGEDASRDDVSSSFQSLYRYLKAHFPAQFPSLHLDMFIVEHGLCKYKRLMKQQKRRIVGTKGLVKPRAVKSRKG